MTIQGPETRPVHGHSLRLFLPSCCPAPDCCGGTAGSWSLQGFLREHCDGADLYLHPADDSRAPSSLLPSPLVTGPRRQPPSTHNTPDAAPGSAGRQARESVCPWPCAPGRIVPVTWECREDTSCEPQSQRQPQSQSQKQKQQKQQERQERQEPQERQERQQAPEVLLQGSAQVWWRGRAMCVPRHASCLSLTATPSQTPGTPPLKAVVAAAAAAAAAATAATAATTASRGSGKGARPRQEAKQGEQAAAAAAAAGTHGPPGSSMSHVRLQVFLYDVAAWRQVAAAEEGLPANGDDGDDGGGGDGDTAVQAAGAVATGQGASPLPMQPLLLPLPLPLRLALRPAANPFTRRRRAFNPGAGGSDGDSGRDVRGAGRRAAAAASPAAAVAGKSSGKRQEASAAAAAALPAASGDADGAQRQLLLHPLLLREAAAAGVQAVLGQSAVCGHARHITQCVAALRHLHAHHLGRGSGGRRGSPASEGAAPDRGRSRGRSGPAQSATARRPRGSKLGAASAAPAAPAAAAAHAGGPGGGGSGGGGSDGGLRGLVRARQSGGVALAACVVLSLLVQLAAGPVVAAAAWRHRAALAEAMEAAAAGAERLLRERYDWLATATPAGVKLHGELCALAAAAAHALLGLGGAAARGIWPRCWTAAAAALAAAFGVAGLGGGLALLHDLLLLIAAGPLRLQAAATAALLRRHTACLAAAWAMVRGGGEATAAARRRRQLRQQAAQQRRALGQGGGAGGTGAAAAAAAAAADSAPSDGPATATATAAATATATAAASAGGGVPISRLETLLGLAPDPGARDEVVVEPLIVGVLLFVPLLALLPTVAAWHLLAAAAAALGAAVRAALAAAAGLLRLSPVTVLGWRLARPLDFAGVDVMLQLLPPRPACRHTLADHPPRSMPGGHDNGHATVAHLAPQPLAATPNTPAKWRRHKNQLKTRQQETQAQASGWKASEQPPGSRRRGPDKGGAMSAGDAAGRSSSAVAPTGVADCAGVGGGVAGGCAQPGPLCFGVTPLPRPAGQVVAQGLWEGVAGGWCDGGAFGPVVVMADAARLLAARRH